MSTASAPADVALERLRHPRAHHDGDPPVFSSDL